MENVANALKTASSAIIMNANSVNSHSISMRRNKLVKIVKYKIVKCVKIKINARNVRKDFSYLIIKRNVLNVRIIVYNA